MTISAHADPVCYPFNEAEGLQLNEAYAAAREAPGMIQVRMPYGEPAWLATRYADGSTPTDTACGMALDVDVVSVTKIASGLERATENAPTPAPRAIHATAPARFARDPAEFRRVKPGLDEGDRRRQGGHPPMTDQGDQPDLARPQAGAHGSPRLRSGCARPTSGRCRRIGEAV